MKRCLNPCCYGRWSQRGAEMSYQEEIDAVLILVVMEDGLRGRTQLQGRGKVVLILVVMEDGLRVTSIEVNERVARQVLILVVMEDGLRVAMVA